MTLAQLKLALSESGFTVTGSSPIRASRCVPGAHHTLTADSAGGGAWCVQVRRPGAPLHHDHYDTAGDLIRGLTNLPEPLRFRAPRPESGR